MGPDQGSHGQTSRETPPSCLLVRRLKQSPIAKTLSAGSAATLGHCDACSSLAPSSVVYQPALFPAGQLYHHFSFSPSRRGISPGHFSLNWLFALFPLFCILCPRRPLLYFCPLSRRTNAPAEDLGFVKLPPPRPVELDHIILFGSAASWSSFSLGQTKYEINPAHQPPHLHPRALFNYR